MAFVILDPGLHMIAGHHFELDTALLEAASALGVPGHIFCHRTDNPHLNDHPSITPFFDVLGRATTRDPYADGSGSIPARERRRVPGSESPVGCRRHGRLDLLLCDGAPAFADRPRSLDARMAGPSASPLRAAARVFHLRAPGQRRHARSALLPLRVRAVSVGHTVAHHLPHPVQAASRGVWRDLGTRDHPGALSRRRGVRYPVGEAVRLRALVPASRRRLRHQPQQQGASTCCQP